jgi:hypothetical protein
LQFKKTKKKKLLKKIELNRNSSKLDTSPRAGGRERFVIFSTQATGTLINTPKHVTVLYQPTIKITWNQLRINPDFCVWSRNTHASFYQIQRSRIWSTEAEHSSLSDSTILRPFFFVLSVCRMVLPMLGQNSSWAGQCFDKFLTTV